MEAGNGALVSAIMILVRLWIRRGCACCQEFASV